MGQVGRTEADWRRNLMSNRDREGFNCRDVRQNGTGGVMLNPLTKICIRVLMTVVIGGGQLVVDFQRNRKRSQGQKQQPKSQRDSGTSL